MKAGISKILKERTTPEKLQTKKKKKLTFVNQGEPQGKML